MNFLMNEKTTCFLIIGFIEEILVIFQALKSLKAGKLTVHSLICPKPWKLVCIPIYHIDCNIAQIMRAAFLFHYESIYAFKAP